MVLNVDGSCTGNLGSGSYGGLIWDSNGTWLMGSMGAIFATTNPLHAELVAMLHGLELAWEERMISSSIAIMTHCWQ